MAKWYDEKRHLKNIWITKATAIAVAFIVKIFGFLNLFSKRVKPAERSRFFSNSRGRLKTRERRVCAHQRAKEKKRTCHGSFLFLDLIQKFNSLSEAKLFVGAGAFAKQSLSWLRRRLPLHKGAVFALFSGKNKATATAAAHSKSFWGFLRNFFQKVP